MFEPILAMVSSFSALGSVCPELLLHSSSWFPPLGGSGRTQEALVLALPLSAFLTLAVGLSFSICSFILPRAPPHGVTSPCH